MKQVSLSRRRVLFLLPAALLGCSSTEPLESQPISSGGAASAYYPELPAHDTDSKERGAGDNPWIVGWGGGSTEEPDMQGSGAALGEPSPSGGAGGGAHPPQKDEVIHTWIFDEVREGTGSDKFAALRPFDLNSPDALGPCEVLQFSNGSTTPWRRVSLGSSAGSQRMTLCTSVSPEHPCDILLGGSLFNGNDALVIQCGGTPVDRLGQLGHDPGEAWTHEDGRTTKDAHLLRCDVAPDPDPWAPFQFDGWVLWTPEDPTRADARLRCSDQAAGGASSL